MVPDNFIVVKDSPQIAVLEKTDMYVCHGGYNSTMEAIVNLVP